MELERYNEYFLPYIELYNKKVVKHLENQIIDMGLASKKSDTTDTISIEKIKANHKNSIVGCVKEIGIKAIKLIEKWEFEKNYEYSVLYKANNLNSDELLEKLQNKYDSNSKYPENIYSILKDPIVYEVDDLIMLKFSLYKEATHPQTEEKLKMKYPIIVIFYTDDNTIEIRYDSIGGLFVDDYKSFYKKNIRGIQAWISTYLEIGLENYLLDKIVNDLKNIDDIELEGQDMRFSDGGKACLEVGSNASYTLPLLGELKKIINENEEEFNNSIGIKQLLETWIKSKEDEAVYTWICLCWKNKDNIKARDVKVRFQFDYIDEDVSLLYHYSGPIGMERMNNVTRCIIKNTDLA